MTKIGLLSDTHSYLDPAVFDYFAECDELWHAGDVGDASLLEQLEAFKPLRGVYGNIDDATVRARFPLNLHFQVEGLSVFMTHIGGYPGRYKSRVRKILDEGKARSVYLRPQPHTQGDDGQAKTVSTYEPRRLR